MSPLLHYSSAGSANPDWIREMRAIEADCDFEPLPPGPMEPELPPAIAALFEDDHLSELADDWRAEAREQERADRDEPR